MNEGGRQLQGSPYVDDDGEANDILLGELYEWQDGATTYPTVLSALVEARLLVPVVAILGEVEYDDSGRARDKTSDMATVLLTGADGRRALLAFTDVAMLTRWNRDARPVPVSAQLAAATAVQEGADALVIDVGSSRTFTLEEPDLHRIAAGWRPVPIGDGEWAWLGTEPESGKDSPTGEQLR